MAQVRFEILKSKITITGLTLFMAIFVLAGEAAAQIPSPNVYNNGNRWIIRGFRDNSPVHAPIGQPHGICFLPYGLSGTNITGLWYSDTFPNWRGRYSQEGDRILMHGNFFNDFGSDGIIIELFAGLTPRDVGAGHWTEWLNPTNYGITVVYANASLTRVGKCHTPAGVDADTMSQPELEKMGEELSSRVSPRMRADGTESDHPADPEQLPLAEAAPGEPSDK